MSFDVLFQSLQVTSGYTPMVDQDVANKAYVDAKVIPSLPPGMMAPFGGSAAPSGWLMCDGSQVSRTGNANLFAAIGTSYGAGDSTNNFFNLPDLRGKFLRGTDNMGTPLGAASNDPDAAGRGPQPGGTGPVLAGCGTTNGSAVVTVPSTTDLAPGMTVSGTGIPTNTVIRSIGSGQITLGNAGNTTNMPATAGGTVSLTFGGAATGNYVGSIQGDAFQGHWHSVQDATNSLADTNNGATGGTAATLVAGSTIVAKTIATDGSNGTPRTSKESRPLNAYVNFIIKT